SLCRSASLVLLRLMMLLCLSFALCLIFFFSSRRRHTRFSRDWSSDVCSSDLTTFVRRGAGRAMTGRTLGATIIRPSCLGRSPPRSEERRVGKGVDLGGRRYRQKQTPRAHRI